MIAILVILPIHWGVVSGLSDAEARVKVILERIKEQQINSSNGPIFQVPFEDRPQGTQKHQLSRLLLREEISRLTTAEDPRLHYILDTTILSRGAFTLFTAYSKKNPGSHLLIKKVKLVSGSDIEAVMAEITAGLLLQATPSTSTSYKNLLNVARFYEAFVYDNNAWIVLENVNGLALKDVPRDLVNDKFVWTLARTLFEAACLMREAGVCHSDLSLDTIMIDSTGRLVINDFKKAKMMSDMAVWDFKEAPLFGDGGVWPSALPGQALVAGSRSMDNRSGFAAFQHAISNERCTDLPNVVSIITKITQATKLRSDSRSKGLLKYLRALHEGLDLVLSGDSMRKINDLVFGRIGIDEAGTTGRLDLNMKLLLGELYRPEVTQRLGMPATPIEEVLQPTPMAPVPERPVVTVTSTTIVTEKVPMKFSQKPTIVNVPTTSSQTTGTTVSPSTGTAITSPSLVLSTASSEVEAKKKQSEAMAKIADLEDFESGLEVSSAERQGSLDGQTDVKSDVVGPTHDVIEDSIGIEMEAMAADDPTEASIPRDEMLVLQAWLAKQFNNTENSEEMTEL